MRRQKQGEVDRRWRKERGSGNGYENKWIYIYTYRNETKEELKKIRKWGHRRKKRGEEKDWEEGWWVWNVLLDLIEFDWNQYLVSTPG